MQPNQNQNYAPDPLQQPDGPADQATEQQVTSPQGGMRTLQPLESPVSVSVPEKPQVMANDPPSAPPTAIPPTQQPAVQLNTPTPPAVAEPVPLPSPSNIYPQPQTNLSRSEAEMAAATEGKKKRKEKILLFTPILLIVLGLIATAVALYMHGTFSKLTTVSVTNRGYTYSFKYYKKATLENSSLEGYKYLNEADFFVEPYNGNVPSNCSMIAKSYYQAFTVNINGISVPVCTGPLQNNNPQISQVFIMLFNAFNHSNIAVAGFKKSDRQMPSDYPTLKAIFSSIKVKK